MDLKRPAELTAKKKVKGTGDWKGIIFGDYPFPPDSAFGLGLMVENKSQYDLKLVLAELTYLINTETKNRPLLLGHLRSLPWVSSNRKSDYNPQTIAEGESKTLVVVNWNMEDNELWFPTDSIEDAKKPSIVVISDGIEKQRLRIRNNRQSFWVLISASR